MASQVELELESRLESRLELEWNGIGIEIRFRMRIRMEEAAQWHRVEAAKTLGKKLLSGARELGQPSATRAKLAARPPMNGPGGSGRYVLFVQAKSAHAPAARLHGGR